MMLTRQIIAVMLGLALALTARADFSTFGVDLTTDQETSPVDAPNAQGTGILFFDSDASLLTWSVQFEGLTGTGATMAHIHQAATGVPGPVEINFDTAPGVALSGVGATEGFFLGSAFLDDDPANSAGPLGLISALFDGDLYVNIHTDLHGGGEIRGQILPASIAVVPIPAAAWLMLSALGVVFLGRRRRR